MVLESINTTLFSSVHDLTCIFQYSWPFCLCLLRFWDFVADCSIKLVFYCGSTTTAPYTSSLRLGIGNNK